MFALAGLEYAGYRNFNIRVCTLMVSMFDTVCCYTDLDASVFGLWAYGFALVHFSGLDEHHVSR